MINYNDLYDVLRKEKYSETLQAMPKNFLDELAEYLNDTKETSAKDDDLFHDNVLKSKKQLENSIALFKELMRIRKKKLLSLVFVANETGIMKRDYENMLVFEREVFDKLAKSLEESDKEMSKILNGRKRKEEGRNKMVIFSQNVEQFVDMDGKLLGPFSAGELANLDKDVAGIIVSSGKAGYAENE